MRVHELAKELNIKSQEVIDTLNGTQFAVKNVQSGLEAVSYTHLDVYKRQAQKIADEAGLDLVKIAPNAKPPVCRVIDYGKYRYEQALPRLQSFELLLKKQFLTEMCIRDRHQAVMSYHDLRDPLRRLQVDEEPSCSHPLHPP